MSFREPILFHIYMYQLFPGSERVFVRSLPQLATSLGMQSMKLDQGGLKSAGEGSTGWIWRSWQLFSAL